LTGVFPDHTAARIKSNVIALLHIDVDVYQSAKDIVEWAVPRIQGGGLIVFDDYGQDGCDGITKLVHELRDMFTNYTFIHNLNGHAVAVCSDLVHSRQRPQT
jgi:O-methyltransferase